MKARLEQLSQLHSYVEGVDKEVTMILQNLQWDRKRLLEVPPMSVCSYDKQHILPQENLKSHEEKCSLNSQNYMKDDLLLPDPLDINSNNLVKLNTQDILKIINDASIKDPLFKKGNVRRFMEPLSMERLQFTYTADERRAIHDAVVQAVPSCHDLADLALPSAVCDKGVKHKEKSRAEILAELRNMKRRRPKYRVAAKTRNYSDVLRDVIRTQMEFYSDAVQSEDTGSIITKDPHCQVINVATPSEAEEKKNIDFDTFVSKYTSRNGSSKRNTEDRRIRSGYYESNRRETKNKHFNRIESSIRNSKERRGDYYKQISYKRNIEIKPHARENPKRFHTTRSDYRREELDQRGKRNRSRESYTRDESADVDSSESDFSERGTYRKHGRRNGNGGYGRESKKSRKRNDYFNLFRDEKEKRKRRSIKKEKLDDTDQEHRSRSSRSGYYDSFNSNKRNRDTKPTDNESTQSSSHSSSHSSSSSSYYSSFSYTDTEEGKSTRRARDNSPKTERRKTRSEYPNNSKYQDSHSTSGNRDLHVTIKTERIKTESRHEETHDVYYSLTNQTSSMGNHQIKVEQTHSPEGEGRDGQATRTKYTTGPTRKSGASREVKEKYNQPVLYDNSTGSRTKETSRYYSDHGEENRGEDDMRRRRYDVYSNDKAYERHYTKYRERDSGKRTHYRQS